MKWKSAYLLKAQTSNSSDLLDNLDLRLGIYFSQLQIESVFLLHGFSRYSVTSTTTSTTTYIDSSKQIFYRLLEAILMGSNKYFVDE